MRAEEVSEASGLSVITRYELLVGVSNAIGTHRDPKDLFSALARELHRVVRFHYVGVSIRDEKLNTFHRHFVDAETEADVPPDPELAMEESDAWWVYQNQEPLVTSLDVHHARFSKFQEILKKKVWNPQFVHSPLNHSPQQSWNTYLRQYSSEYLYRRRGSLSFGGG
jgi:transcriptional regulator with GAF, ATPase, and Fis domain